MTRTYLIELIEKLLFGVTGIGLIVLVAVLFAIFS
jgi:hypothetical protein